jgi:hypothetical protein
MIGKLDQCWHRQTGRLFLLVPLLSILVSCDGGGCWHSRNSACFDPRGAVSSVSLSSAPTETALYTYMDLNPEQNDFRFTGHTLRFIFENRDYRYYANFLGGAQERVGLIVDKVTFEPMTAKIMRETGARTVNAVDLASKRYQSRYLNIEVQRAKSGDSGTDFSWALNIKSKVKSQSITPIRSACGFDLYDQSIVEGDYVPVDRKWVKNNRNKAILDNLDLYSLNIVGLAQGNERNRAVSCVYFSDVCSIAFLYRGHGVSYQINKNEFCKNAEISNRIEGLLDKHRAL